MGGSEPSRLLPSPSKEAPEGLGSPPAGQAAGHVLGKKLGKPTREPTTRLQPPCTVGCVVKRAAGKPSRAHLAASDGVKWVIKGDLSLTRTRGHAHTHKI